MIKDPDQLRRAAAASTLPRLSQVKLAQLEENVRDALACGTPYSDGVGLGSHDLLALLLELRSRTAGDHRVRMLLAVAEQSGVGLLCPWCQFRHKFMEHGHTPDCPIFNEDGTLKSTDGT